MNSSEKNTIQRLIRRKEVCEKTGLGVSSIYALMAEGLFPKSINLSERRVAWVESEVDEWVFERISARENLKKGI